MFKWLKRIDPESSGLSQMMRQFGQMLTEGRHIFDAATNAFLGGTDPEVVREDLFATDQTINELEQAIRREVVVHGSVHGASELPACLVLMSIVKDAERIGDYCKNVFDLAVRCRKRKDDVYYADLVRLKNVISQLLAEARSIYGAQDEENARDFVKRIYGHENHCDARVDALLADDPKTTQPAATALCYRYYKRVLAHLSNIVSSIFVPVDRLDYYDESPAREDT
jgi:phosphate uptake regulator